MPPTPQTVIITIDNVNEAPRVTIGVTKNEHQENMPNDSSTADIDETVFIDTYTVEDVDVDDAIKWSLMGDDKDAFEFDPPSTPDIDATDGVTNNLVFKKSPNYEKPTDTDMDNMYMVHGGRHRREEAHRHAGRGHHRQERQRRRDDNLVVGSAQGRDCLHRHPNR